MGLTVVVGSIAMVPAALALSLKNVVPLPVTLALTHIAATGFVVAAAASIRLASRTTWLLGKDGTGRISPVSLLVWWPYHLGLRGKLYIQWRKSSEPLFNKITPDLYLGGWPESPQVLPPGQLAVLDVTCELPRTHSHAYLALPTWDTQAPNAGMIDAGVLWATQELAERRPVYIHCAHGHGRSATVMAALLIATGQASSADEAVAIMRRARPRVRLNKQQRMALMSWIDTKHSSKAKDS